ncbi:hypothetical protein [Bacillus sp. JCM 19041]|uniref:hypothetical protein n=1 Tax=Bacillus sp. JCM 19041 TaxID=1460637 RepID=UPI0006CF68E5
MVVFFFGLHPGDEAGKELADLFPNLFEKKTDWPVIHKLNEIRTSIPFASFQIETKNTIEYLHSPIDVLKMACFGQVDSVFKAAKQVYGNEVKRVFAKKGGETGLPITYARYLVRGSK